MPRRAYTLVEVLAVTVLLGVVASLGVPPLLRAISGDALARAADRLAQSFRDARAQGYGQRLDFDLDSWGFAAVAGEGRARTTVAEVRLGDGIQAGWTRNGRPLRRLELDPRGHGLDATLALRQDGRELRFAIDGLTGTWLPAAPP